MGFRVWGLGFGVWGLGFKASGLGFGVWGLGFKAWGLEFRDLEVQGGYNPTKTCNHKTFRTIPGTPSPRPNHIMNHIKELGGLDLGHEYKYSWVESARNLEAAPGGS